MPDFLTSQPAYQPPIRPLKKMFRIFLPLLVFGGGIALLLVLILGKVASDGLQGKKALTAVQQALQDGDLVTAKTQAVIAEAKFINAKQALSLITFLKPVPLVGPRIRASDDILKTGVAATSALSELLGIGSKIFSVLGVSKEVSGSTLNNLPSARTLFRDLSPEQKRQMLGALASGAPAMIDAIEKITVALQSLDAVIANPAAADFVSTLAPFRPKLVKARDELTLFLPVAKFAPTLLGYPSQKNYLIFFQNNTELRPSGGFLGVYGVVTVRDADIVSMETNDIYSLDSRTESSTLLPPPPAPLQKYLGIDKWYLRDANWSPDFSIAAQTMEVIYAKEFAIAWGAPAMPIDGVIGVTPTVLEDVLRFTGPITVDGITFTSANVVDELEFQVEKAFVAKGIDYWRRKDIVKKLLETLVDRLKTYSLAQLQTTLGIVKKNLDEGHIAFSFSDQPLQQYVLENDWGGKLKPVNGDYLLVVDANLASLKTDPVMRRTVTYRIDPSGGGYQATVTLRYTNTGSFTWKTSRYRTYTRIYVPDGSQFVGVVGAMENDKLKDRARRPGKADVGKELERTSFGAFVSIEPGETRELSFTYMVAPTIAAQIRNGTYTLSTEKQLGTIANGLTVDLNFGKKLKSATPAEVKSEWGDTRYRYATDLRIDRVFMIGLE